MKLCSKVIKQRIYCLEIKKKLDFPAGPAVKNQPDNAGRGHGFGPWSAKIPHAREQLSLCTTTSEASTLESVLQNKRSHCSEKPMHDN